ISFCGVALISSSSPIIIDFIFLFSSDDDDLKLFLKGAIIRMNLDTKEKLLVAPRRLNVMGNIEDECARKKLLKEEEMRRKKEDTERKPIPNDSFPEHYIKFAAYNEVQSKGDMHGATLTDFINPIAALEIQRQPCATDEQEQMQNQYSVESLLNVNPQHYQRVRFTTEATIIQVNATRGWYYKKCIACNMKVIVESSDPQYADHGPQPTTNYG
ncbi:hypothetical protein Tco_1374275, partial [Tanacetum coccineum]